MFDNLSLCHWISYSDIARSRLIFLLLAYQVNPKGYFLATLNRCFSVSLSLFFFIIEHGEVSVLFGTRQRISCNDMLFYEAVKENFISVTVKEQINE